jgi:SNF2 family DNA or RNA helicase
MYEEQVAEYNEGLITAVTAGVKVSKLLQIAAGCVYDQEGNPIEIPIKGKIEAITHIHEQVGRVVIFTQFVEAAKRLHAELPNSRLIYGDVSLNARAKILEDFKAGLFDYLIAQPRTMAYGVNLQFCDTVIFFGPVLGNNFYRQAIARVRRIGQTKTQRVINFVTSKEEAKLFAMLERKETTSQQLLSLYKNE